MGQRAGIAPPRLLIDTDAANYFDDQFAIAYAAMAADTVRLEALYAAPFVNARITKTAQGMRRSYREIGEVLGALGLERNAAVRQGARTVLRTVDRPVKSPAARDIIERTANARPDGCYLVSIGPATNAASALLMDPGLASRITVVWLGGTPHDFPTASEFNLRQDPHAVRTLLNSGVRLVHVPAQGVAERVSISPAAIESRLQGAGAIADLLLTRVREHAAHDGVSLASTAPFAIWDMAAVATLAAPGTVDLRTVPSPVLGHDLRWHAGQAGRHTIQVATSIDAEAVLDDFFGRLRPPQA